jgi:hypothetical protein
MHRRKLFSKAPILSSVGSNFERRQIQNDVGMNFSVGANISVRANFALKKLPSGVDAMIIIFVNFCQFSAKMLAFF